MHSVLGNVEIKSSISSHGLMGGAVFTYYRHGIHIKQIRLNKHILIFHSFRALGTDPILFFVQRKMIIPGER